MRDVLQDPGVDLERISMLWDEYSKETRQWHKKLVDARFQLKNDLSREDWAKVFPAQ